MFFLLLVCACLIPANGASAPKPTVFYGVDFSMARVFGASESAGDFIDAFNRINELFVNEAKKYDPKKAFRSKDMTMSLTMVRTMADNINKRRLKLDHNNYQPSAKEIEQRVKTYRLGEKDGTGAIIIAALLDKPHEVATYHSVVFDIRSRKIISTKVITGKPGGFGLRNYWAGSLHHAMKRLAKSK